MPTEGPATTNWLAIKDLPARRGYADNGAPTLRAFQNGLDVSHVGAPANKTLVGHSYGTTVIGHAATSGGVDADAVVLVASPGVGADKAAQLSGIPADRVYATVAQNDPIRYTPDALHGRGPEDPVFGAKVFPSGPGSFGPAAHSQYWDDGNPARDHMAAVITGNYDRVPVIPSPRAVAVTGTVAGSTSVAADTHRPICATDRR